MDQYIHGIAVAARGVPVTLIISLVAVLGGLVLGLLVALAKRSKFKILRGIATVYVDILRGTPLLVQVLILGYGVPQLVRAITGMQFNWEPLILVGFIACGVNSSAYMAEITAGRPCGMSSCHRLLRSSFRHWEMNLLR